MAVSAAEIKNNRIIDLRERQGRFISNEEYLELLASVSALETLKQQLNSNAEATLDYRVKNPVPLAANPEKGEKNPRKITHYLFERAKEVSYRIPNIKGNRPSEKRGLSIAIVDTEQAINNFCDLGVSNNDIACLVNNIDVYSSRFNDVIEYSRKGDGLIVVDMYTGLLKMARAVFKGFSEKHFSGRIIDERVNTRTLNTVLASNFGASVIVKNSTGEVAAYEAGKIMEISHKCASGGKARLYCNINNVSQTLTAYIA